MPVSITCRKTEISESLHDLVVNKTRKLKKYFDKVDRIDVIFAAEKHRRSCEITVRGAPLSLTALAEDDDERTAFEKTLKSISRQVRDGKARMLDRKRKPPVPLDRAVSQFGEVEEPPAAQAVL